jgi:hypothetical protein
MARSPHHRHIPLTLRDRVAEQAHYRCGYCLTDQRISGAQMHIEHIVPLSRGGKSDETNLWLACAWCNSYKGDKTHALDPVTEEEVPLFNPRTQPWSEHFRWSEDGVRIIGLTPTGRATVLALRLNNEFILPARRHWVLAGWHPPEE